MLLATVINLLIIPLFVECQIFVTVATGVGLR